jgi:hypothetical protein
MAELDDDTIEAERDDDLNKWWIQLKGSSNINILPKESLLLSVSANTIYYCSS